MAGAAPDRPRRTPLTASGHVRLCGTEHARERYRVADMSCLTLQQWQASSTADVFTNWKASRAPADYTAGTGQRSPVSSQAVSAAARPSWLGMRHPGKSASGSGQHRNGVRHAATVDQTVGDAGPAIPGVADRFGEPLPAGPYASGRCGRYGAISEDRAAHAVWLPPRSG